MQLQQSNIYMTAIKQYVQKVMPSKYTEDIDDSLSRISSILVTKKDVETFLQLLNETYNAGYIKAIDATKNSLAEHGMVMELVSPKTK